MFNKKLIGLVTTVVLTVSTVCGASSKNFGVNPQEMAKGNLNQILTSADGLNYNYKFGGPVDVVMANKEKIAEMLKREGKIPKNATEEEIEKIVNAYLKDSSKANTVAANTATKAQKKLAEHKMDNLMKSSGAQGNGWDGKVRKDKLLVLLIDFKDYKHDQIKSNETGMYYKSYDQKHFQDMIFGDKGYAGPNGENLVSMKQYYEAQSGGSYTIEGTVTKWYTAKHEASYYGGNESKESKDVHARELIKEALENAAKDPSINLKDFDQEDRYDVNENGNYREADSVIDHVLVVHAGMGEEAGGGSLNSNAIWSHRSSLGTEDWQITGSDMKANDYTVEPEDGAAGVFSHEYGHDLGLPDEYDTQYSGAGEPVDSWSIMSSGSWAGKIPGTEPTGFSPFAKEFFQANVSGNWANIATVNLRDIPAAGQDFKLDQASKVDKNNSIVKVLLPDKGSVINKPTSGTKEYYSTKINKSLSNTNISAAVDLSSATSGILKFKTWYDLEAGFDFGSVQVKEEGKNTWTPIKGNISSKGGNVAHSDAYVENGFTGSTDGKWVDAEFNLNAYVGKKIEVKIQYNVDQASFNTGLYVDDINIQTDKGVILSDDAEGASKFTLNGFVVDTGVTYSKNYYLLEWRNHTGVDQGLAHIKMGGNMLSFDPGLVVWYVDNFYDNNWTGVHPGEGFLGIVDANQKSMEWIKGNGSKTVADTAYQLHDAAFSLRKGAVMNLSGSNGSMKYDPAFPHPFFSDSKSYLNPKLPDAGRNVPKLGLSVYVTGESSDRGMATIHLTKSK